MSWSKPYLESTQIETDRLLLRPWTLADIEDALAIWGDPKVLRYVGGTPYKDIEEAKKSIQRAIASHGHNGCYRWAIQDKASQRVIGGCGFHILEERKPDLEIIYHLGSVYWGRGLASEAVGCCLQYAATHEIADTIFAIIYRDNIASQRVAEKFGFVYTHTEDDEKWYELKLHKNSLC